jgi:hypothetical protein
MNRNAKPHSYPEKRGLIAAVPRSPGNHSRRFEKGRRRVVPHFTAIVKETAVFVGRPKKDRMSELINCRMSELINYRMSELINCPPHPATSITQRAVEDSGSNPFGPIHA